MPQRMRVSSYQLGKRSLIQCMKTEWSIVQYSVLLPCTSVCPPAHLQFGPSQPRHKNVCLNLCCKSCLCTKLPFEWIQVTYQACLKSWISFFFCCRRAEPKYIPSHMHGKRTADRKYQKLLWPPLACRLEADTAAVAALQYEQI